MITKAQIAALVADIKAGGDPPENSKYHPKNIAVIVDFVRNTLIETEYRQTGTISDILVKGFNNVKVQKDTERDESFSELPSTIAAIMDNLGLRQVSPMKDQKMVFAISFNGARAMFEGLEGQLTQRTIVYPEGNKIFYENIDPNVEKVLIKMIPSVLTLKDNDPIPVPANKEKLLIDLVREQLDEAKFTVQDKYNDANSQQLSRYQRMRDNL